METLPPKVEHPEAEAFSCRVSFGHLDDSFCHGERDWLSQVFEIASVVPAHGKRKPNLSQQEEGYREGH